MGLPAGAGPGEGWGQQAEPGGEGAHRGRALRVLCWSLQAAKARPAPAEKQKAAVVENGKRLSSCGQLPQPCGPAPAQRSLLAGEVGTETRSLLEQLRGEALKFHKPGEYEELLPCVGLCARSQFSVLQRTSLAPRPSLWAAGLGSVWAMLEP